MDNTPRRFTKVSKRSIREISRSTITTRRSTALAAVATVLVSFSLLGRATVPQVPTNTWAPTGDMANARTGASAALLYDGRVLVTGGISDITETTDNGPITVTRATALAERYSPTGSRFLDTAPMQNARADHSSTLLPDGRVLVAGGVGVDRHALSAAEIYDPSTNGWTAVAPMYHPRAGHTATLLADGRVLMAGGDDAGVSSDTLELFDPAVGMFSAVEATMSAARVGHAAALISVGEDTKVLIAGGFDGTTALASVDVYDPATGSVTPGPSMSTARAGHSATTLLNGKVLVAGGAGNSSELASAEMFDPTSNAFTPADNLMAAPRQRHLAFLLPHNNNVLIVGGTSDGSAIATAEMFVPWEGANGAFCSGSVCSSGYAGPLAPGAVRTWATGSALSFPASQTNRSGPADGLLLLAGGTGLKSAELYGFTTIKTDKDDYAPGTTVTITGSGWQPGEWVALMLKEWPEFDEHQLVDVQADENGNIVSTEFVPDQHDIGILFYLTAFGSTSQAQTLFRDSAVTVTAATGGSAISADTAGGTYTSLTGPILVEGTQGDIRS
jgi:hypothetical protein